MVHALALCLAVSIYDADTVRLSCPGEPVRSYRIADVDAPERGWRAECPAERMLEALARRVAAAMILGRDVGVETHYHDRWGRPIVSVTLPDGSDYAARLVEAGAALPWPHDDEGQALAARPDWCGERR